MTKTLHISTNEIRQDLLGFLESLAAGQKYTVLNRSKPIVTVSGRAIGDPLVERSTIKMLALAAEARAMAQVTIAAEKTYKELYAEMIEAKHGIPRR